MKIDSSFVAIITGGASGLGEACVDMLVKQGAKVAAFDMNDEQGQQLQAKNPEQILFCKCNVVDEQSVQAAIQKTIEKFGVIRAVVNAAGVGNPQKVVGKNHQPHDLKAFQFVVNINLIGTFNVLRLAAAEMAKHKPVDNDGQRGVIINVASVAAFDGQIGQAAYSASKAGVVGMTLPIARELAQHGIRVNCIAPGLFLTPMLMKLPEKAQQSLGKQVPFPAKLGEPRQFAQLVEHLIENDYMNGENIRLDGSIRMAAK